MAVSSNSDCRSRVCGGLYRGSGDTGYLPFYFQGYRILSILLPGIWDTMFNFRDTAIFPPKYSLQIQSRNTNNINKNHFKFSAKEEKLYVHYLASLSRPGPLDRV